MNPLRIPPLLLPALLSAADQPPEGWTSPLAGLTEVGSVFRDCDHVTRRGRPADTPIGFLITPNAAFKLALDKVRFRCPSLYGNHVFADNDWYYITVGPTEVLLQMAKPSLTPAILKDAAIRVHGLTGKVIPPHAAR